MANRSVTGAAEWLGIIRVYGRPTTDHIMTELFAAGHRIRSVHRDQIIH